MAARKIFLWLAEGTVLLGIVLAVNAPMFMSVYYYVLKILDKIKGLIY